MGLATLRPPIHQRQFVSLTGSAGIRAGVFHGWGNDCPAGMPALPGVRKCRSFIGAILPFRFTARPHHSPFA
jgi:hypothetical protein